MRRRDREINDVGRMTGIIKRCSCCRIGFNDNGKVYIVPLNFGYEQKDHAHVFYFHGAQEGRKVDLIQNSPEVGFEMDVNYQLNEADFACGYSARFQSIIGNGIVSLVTDFEEKKHGLSVLMEHSTGKYDWEFDENMVKAAMVFKLEVTEMTCKEHA